MTKPKAPIQRLINRVLEVAEKIYDETEHDLFSQDENEKTVENIADKLAVTKLYRIKDFDEAIFLLTSGLDSIMQTDRNGVIDKRKYELNFKARIILNRAKELRTIKNRVINKVETNLLATSPFFVGGKDKPTKNSLLKEKVVFQKDGIKSITYENHNGRFMSMHDAKTLFALFSIWEDQGKGEWFSFTTYDLLAKMDLDKGGGKQFRLLRDSLETIQATEVVMKEFYQKGKGRRIETKSFALIIARKLIENEQDGVIRSREYQFQFSPYIRESFTEGYYSLVSLAIFDQLSLEVSKGMYLMLSALRSMEIEEKQKFTHPEGFYQIPLKTIYSHLRIETDEYNSKRRIMRSCEELVEVDVITSFNLAGEGKKPDSLRLYPSKWFREFLDGKNPESLSSGGNMPIMNESWSGF